MRNMIKDKLNLNQKKDYKHFEDKVEKFIWQDLMDLNTKRLSQYEIEIAYKR